MKKTRRFCWMVCLASLMCLASAGLAQQGRQGMMMQSGNDSSQLLRRTDVQQELGLSKDQIQKVTDILNAMNQATQEKMRELMTGGNTDRESINKELAGVRASYRKKIDEVLTKDQQQRLFEISLHVNGFNSLSMPEVQKELGLTEDQKTKIAQILRESQQRQMQRMMELRQSGAGLDREAMQTEMQKAREATGAELGKILTADQQEKFKKLKGKPFGGKAT